MPIVVRSNVDRTEEVARYFWIRVFYPYLSSELKLHHMKILKYILIVLGILVLLWVILNSVGPKEVDMERSTTIDASKEVVWSKIRSLEAMGEWGPWMEMDPNAEADIEGPEGEVGSKGWWKGEKIGEGSQTISEVVPYESMSVDMEFMMGDEPMPADAKIAMAEAENDMIEVVWSYHMHMPWMMRGMGMFMGDGAAGEAYVRGLSNLKELCENTVEEVVEESAWEIKEVEREAARYLGIRATISHDEIGTFIPENMPKMGMAVGPLMTGMPVSIYFEWDEENKTTNMAVAGPVAEGDAEGMEEFKIDAGKALLLEYFGSYDASYDAHMAINKHMQDNGIEMRDVVIEEYITDPGTEPDTSKWQTNIIYMIQ